MLLLLAPSPTPRLPSAGGQNHPQIPAKLSVAWCLGGDMRLVSRQHPLIQFVRDAGCSAEPNPSITKFFSNVCGRPGSLTFHLPFNPSRIGGWKKCWLVNSFAVPHISRETHLLNCSLESNIFKHSNTAHFLE